MRPDIQVRLAMNEEGDQVGALVSQTGDIPDNVDWSSIFPYWLVALYEGNIIGTIQVCPSRPVGRLEGLYVLEGLKPNVKTMAIWMLITTGNETLKRDGAQFVSGHVAFELKAYKKFLKKRGASTLATGNLLIWGV